MMIFVGLHTVQKLLIGDGSIVMYFRILIGV